MCGRHRRRELSQTPVQLHGNFGDDVASTSSKSVHEQSQEGHGADDGTGEDEDVEEEDAEEEDDESEARARVGTGFRIWRAVELVILEGRWLGTSFPSAVVASNNDEPHNCVRGSTGPLTDVPNTTEDAGLGGGAAFGTARSYSVHNTADLTSSRNSRGSAESKERSVDDTMGSANSQGVEREKDKSGTAGAGVGVGFDTFCEVVLDDQVVARTAVKKGSHSPFWRESFAFKYASEAVPSFYARAC
jgi:hypothetical protein